MIILGSLGFLEPWILTALLSLPLIWLLLRLTPPAPRDYAFPALRLLYTLKKTEETPQKTPWWLLLLRCLIVTLIIGGFAHPLLNPVVQKETSQKPLLLLIDDDWASAPVWPNIRAMAYDTLQQAKRDGVQVQLLFTSEGANDKLPDEQTPQAAETTLAQHNPVAWPVARAPLAAKMAQLAPHTHVIYFSSNVASSNDDAFIAALSNAPSKQLLKPSTQHMPLIFKELIFSDTGLDLTVMRAPPFTKRDLPLRALAADGRNLLEMKVPLVEDNPKTVAHLALPADVRRLVTRIDSPDEPSAAAVFLSDAYWSHKQVGIGTSRSDSDKPLIGDLYYLRRALAPFAETITADVDTLLAQKLSLIILSDMGHLAQDQKTHLISWMHDGGVLVRFAGPQMAEPTSNTPDDLLPLPLRQGMRSVGGSLSWTQPLTLQPLPQATPLAGLKAPQDVTVSKQILPELSKESADKANTAALQTWAQLSDGTPLISARQMGQGWLILVHTAPSPDWTTLVYSGFFVEMFDRFLHLSTGQPITEINQPLTALDVLDAFGTSHPAPASMAPLPTAANNTAQTIVSAKNPPGFYGTNALRVAHNLGPALPFVLTLPLNGQLAWTEKGAPPTAERDLMPLLLSLALGLLSLDGLLTLHLRGLVTLRPKPTLPMAMLLLLLLLPTPSLAQTIDSDAGTMSANIYLAYIKTGNDAVDSTSADGLKGLASTLSARTIVRPKDVVGVDPETDDLSFFPLLYWPVTPSQPALSESARMALNIYLHHGGVILLDTRDGDSGIDPQDNTNLLRLTQGLDLPALMPIPDNHVLGRSFYLLASFPGLWPEGTLWVEQLDGTTQNDSVSGVIIGGGDWASAWAIRPDGRPATPIPSNGGERQREKAYRFGVNLMMYALTGNYKADQVHLKAILERMGKKK